MCDANKQFELIRKDIDLAQKHFESNNFSAVDYFLGRLSGDIQVLRDMYGRKPCESAESSEGENH